MPYFKRISIGLRHCKDLYHGRTAHLTDKSSNFVCNYVTKCVQHSHYADFPYWPRQDANYAFWFHEDALFYLIYALYSYASSLHYVVSRSYLSTFNYIKRVHFCYFVHFCIAIRIFRLLPENSMSRRPTVACKRQNESTFMDFTPAYLRLWNYYVLKWINYRISIIYLLCLKIFKFTEWQTFIVSVSN